MVYSVDDGMLVLKLRNKLDQDILKSFLPTLENAIADVLGSQIKVRLDIGSGGAATSAPVEEEVTQFEEPSEDADALFNYANERIRER
jgi:hypothetical protein